MGCLIKIKYTTKASDDPDTEFAYPFFLRKYSDFFIKSNVVSRTLEANKCLFTVYVIWPENRTSDFIVNYLRHDKKIEKAETIS